MTRSSSSLRALPILLALGAFRLPISAQEAREDILSRARREPDSVAVRLLMQAVDPSRARCPSDSVPAGEPPRPCLDSLWAMATHSLAERLIDMEHASAAVWLRWAARHGASWPIDEILFRPPVVRAYRAELAEVEQSRDTADAVTRSEWVWPARMDPDADGGLEVVPADASVPLTVSVDGLDRDPGTRGLAPGTYELEISADGYESIVVTREVLPGATTRLTVDLPPLLPADVETAVRSRLVRISYSRGQETVCTNGLLDEQGLVLTSLSRLDQDAPLRVTTTQGTFESVSIFRRDPGRDLAVLKVDGEPSTPLGQRATPAAGQYAWSVFDIGCDGPGAARTRIAGPVDPAGAIGLDPALDAMAQGAPVVDRTGALLGLVTARDRMLGRTAIQEMLDRAIMALREQDPPGEAGGGLPWKWIGGVGAAGVLGAVVLSGGETPPPQDETGSITVTIPGGAP